MKFSPRWRLACALTILTFAACRKTTSPVQSPEAGQVEMAKSNPTISGSLREGAHAPSTPPESPVSTASALESIEAAESPAVLAPYLSSSVPEVRAAAVDAMIRLGDSSAAPLLEAAARTLSTEDAAPLLEAARFLALPDASGLIAGKTAVPRPREVGGRKSPGMGSRKRDTQPAAPQGNDQAPPR